MGDTCEHPILGDSILTDYRDFVREVSVLPVRSLWPPCSRSIASVLTPQATLDFSSSQRLIGYTTYWPTQSTTSRPTGKIAGLFHMKGDLVSVKTSDSTLVGTF